jgi:hypothetical protein
MNLRRCFYFAAALGVRTRPRVALGAISISCENSIELFCELICGLRLAFRNVAVRQSPRALLAKR